jgi:hypothetical protein
LERIAEGLVVQTYGKYIFVGLNHLKPDAPYFHLAPTHEIEHPWRICRKSLVIRLLCGKGLVIGLWRKNKEHWEKSLMEILKGRVVDIQETTASNAGITEDIPANRENLGLS